MRLLNKNVYDTYVIESASHAAVYAELAEFALRHPTCLIEGVTPGMHDDGDRLYYTLILTVSGGPESV